jgi:hypothetical protein
MSFTISNPLSELVETIMLCQHPQQQQHNASFDSSGQIIITSDIAFMDSINNFQISEFNFNTRKLLYCLKSIVLLKMLKLSIKGVYWF